MGLLKEEPALLYMYEYIKEDRSKKEDLTKVIPDEWNIGDMIYTTNPSMDKNYYKFAATYRRAFIGDMQEQIDKANQCNSMKVYAMSKGGNIPIHVWHKDIVYIRVNIFKQFEEWIKGKWKNIKNNIKKNKEEDDYYLEDLLFNKENEPRVFFDKKTNI